jgi:hypothetical protein
MVDDKEKSIVERTIETVKGITHSVSDAAKRVMEPEPLKEDDEIVMIPPMPMADTGMLGAAMTPQFVVIPIRRKSRKKLPKTTAKKTAKKIKAVKKATKRATKKPPKKTKKATKKTTATQSKRAVTNKKKKAKRAG